MALVEVRPIDRERWHGKKGKDSFTRPITIEAAVSLRTGQFATGLTEEDRKRLEAATGYNLSPDYHQGKPHEFFNAAPGQIKLENKTNIFDTSKPLDEIRVKIMKASDLVANSQKEFEEGKFPDAKFVIFDEQEDIELKASKASIKRKVIIETSKLTKSRKAEIVQIVSGVSVRNQSEDYVDLKLDEAIEKEGAEKVLAILQRDKARTAIHALVLEGLHKQVLRKDGTAVYYMDDQIGFDVESAVDYFMDSKNQTLKAQVLEKLN
jgi:hypothetical protein